MGDATLYRPLTILSFLSTIRLAHPAPFDFNLGNLLLHVAVSLMVLALGHRLVGSVAALARALILALWFGWAFAVYGPRITLASNTTVHWTRDMGLAQRAEGPHRVRRGKRRAAARGGIESPPSGSSSSPSRWLSWWSRTSSSGGSPTSASRRLCCG